MDAKKKEPKTRMRKKGKKEGGKGRTPTLGRQTFGGTNQSRYVKVLECVNILLFFKHLIKDIQSLQQLRVATTLPLHYHTG